MDNIQLAQFVDMTSADAVMGEVATILHQISPEFDSSLVDRAYLTTQRLFSGAYPGYRACNTHYHDLTHSTTACLAMARMIHGAILDGVVISDHLVALSLVSALFHDSGFIQDADDTEGTGAKFTLNHVERSYDFIERHHVEHGLSKEDVDICKFIILCTELAIDLAMVNHERPEVELVGKLLGAADLLAQMSDRAYLEKLLFLYHEFKESNVGSYEGEVDLLRKTIGFFEYVDKRLVTISDLIDRYLCLHFATRWQVNKNMYKQAMQRQKAYLEKILNIPDTDPRDLLRRQEIVSMVRQHYGDSP